MEESKPVEYSNDNEHFSDKIQIAAQPLAFRNATNTDIRQIIMILKLAYDCEVHGSESFRSAPVISFDSIDLSDQSYTWLVVEVPSGRGIEADGALIGVCCYSTDGISRKNG